MKKKLSSLLYRCKVVEEDFYGTKYVHTLFKFKGIPHIYLWHCARCKGGYGGMIPTLDFHYKGKKLTGQFCENHTVLYEGKASLVKIKQWVDDNEKDLNKWIKDVLKHIEKWKKRVDKGLVPVRMQTVSPFFISICP